MNIQQQTATSSLEATFFGRVMFFFSLGILASALGTYVGVTYLNQFLFANPMLMWLLFGVEMILILTSNAWSMRYPLNTLLYSAFTFITGLTIAPLISAVIVQMQSPGLVIRALSVSGLMFTAAGVIGWTSHRSFEGLRGFLLLSLVGMILMGVLNIFFPWSNTFEMIYSGVGVLLFSAYAMYDFRRIKKMPDDRYVDAAISLYLDIFNLFIFILRLLLSLNRR